MAGWPDFTQQSQLYQGLDLLIQDGAGLMAPTLTEQFTTVKSYSGLLVFCQPGTAATVSVTVQAAGANIPSWRQRKSTVTNVRPLFFASPFPIPVGTSVQVFLTSSINQTTGSDIWIYGVGTPQPSTQGAALLRRDGYAYPTGEAAALASLVAANGPANVVAAPGNALAILIHSLTLTQATAGSIIEAVGTIKGAGVAIQIVRGVSSGTIWTPPGGLLLDNNTALTIAGSTNPTGDCLAIYDIVPVTT